MLCRLKDFSRVATRSTETQPIARSSLHRGPPSATG
jgi:hypothetical protein